MITFRRLPLAVSLVRLVLLVLAVSSLPAELRAQAPDNKGTDFIVAFPQNLAPPLPPTLTLFVGNDSAADVRFEVSGPGLTTTQFVVLASSVHAGVLIPASQQVTAINANSSKGIRVRSLDPPTAEISVYGLSRKPSFADAYVGLPLDVLGTEYRVISWPGLGAQATIVGAENGTSVTITTPIDTTGFSAGLPRTIPLNHLETFLLQGGDLTGTRVTSDKPVAVFGGNQQAAVPGGTSFDYMVEQMPPVHTWGTEFVVAPIAPRTAGDIVRVLADEETEISLNGTPLTTLDAGSFVEFTVLSTAGSWITTSKPVLVAHYNKGQGQGDSVSTDPFMMLGIPVDQFSNRYLIRTPGTPFTTAISNRLSIVVKDGDEVGLLLDGAALPTGTVWTSVSSSGHRYTRVTVVPGVHRIVHQEPTVRFGVWVYGHALAEGYGYVAGQLVVDQTAPVISSVPDNVTVEATRPDGATVTWDEPTATDFGRGEVPVTCAPASGSVFKLGTTVVNCSAADPAGNTATERSFTVTVQDTTPPELQVPADIVRHATSPSGAVVTYETSASDLVDKSVDVVCDPSSGRTFPLGQTLATCTATDDSGNSTIDTFTVTVGNNGPSCVATPSIPLIWPPNHQLVPIAINGVTDPDGDGVTIRIDSIFQDEPTNDAGDGNTPVDGFGIGTSLAQVRAERSGRGNGRVYRIGFTATDSIGASCSGAVGVAVPHNQKRSPVDEGALYDSTGF